MSLSENAHKTRDLARRLAKEREARMLTTVERKQLLRNSKRDNALSRARYATMKRPDLDNLPPENGK